MWGYPTLLISWFINFNDVNVPRCHTENLSYENIFILFKYTGLVFSCFYFWGTNIKGIILLGQVCSLLSQPLSHAPNNLHLYLLHHFQEHVFISILVIMSPRQWFQKPSIFLIFCSFGSHADVLYIGFDLTHYSNVLDLVWKLKFSNFYLYSVIRLLASFVITWSRQMVDFTVCTLLHPQY